MFKQEYQSIVLAGLLHDIGKFYARSSEIMREIRALKAEDDIVAKHPIVSAYFVDGIRSQIESAGLDFELVKTLVQRHHESNSFPSECRVQAIKAGGTKKLANLVSKADNYSSGERDETEYRGTSYRKALLDSIFSRLDIDKGEAPGGYRIKPAPLSPKNAFPEKISEVDPREMDKLVASFGDEAKALEVHDADELFINLLSLIYKYCWCLPADIREETRDVSLYDHLRTTSAIAACLYRFHSSDNSLDEKSVNNKEACKFQLIGGDLSGIQEYLYAISRMGTKGVAKRLRARSFRISLISEAASHLICQKLNLPLSCILIASGGRFSILAPNDNGSQKLFQELEKEIDSWMLSEFNGELSLSLATYEFSAEDFQRKRFADIFNNINNRLEESKKQKFSSVLAEKELFVRPLAYDKDKGACKACEKAPGEFLDDDAESEQENMYLCRQCQNDLKIGRKLVRANYVTFSNERASDDDEALDFFGRIFVEIINKPHDAHKSYLLSPFLTQEAVVRDFPTFPRFMANFIPKNENNSPLTFEEIAAKSAGAKYLGVLKADVDNLGTLFSRGLGNNAHTISRVSSLSWMLDLFFSGFLPQYLEEHYQNTYVVYAGGDDLLLIGPWNSTIDLAANINKEFTRFTSDNPNVSLSAGLTVANDRTPMWSLAECAKEELEKSKHNTDATTSNGSRKDSLSLFKATMFWSEVPTLDEFRKLLETGIDEDGLSDSFLYRLLFFQKQFDDEGDKIYRSGLSYQIARNIKEESDGLRDGLIKLTTSEGDGIMKHLTYPVSYCLLKQRGTEDG